MISPAKQGSKVILLTKDDTYFEMLSKVEDTIEIMGPTGGTATVSLAQLEAAGFMAKQAYKLIKTDGSWMYITAGQHGADLYLVGKFFPSVPLGRTSRRTL